MAVKLASQTDRPAASAPETPLQLSVSQQSVVQDKIYHRAEIFAHC